jgi:hypothetical protein
VIPLLEDRLSKAEALILEAGSSLPHQMPSTLSLAVNILENTRMALNCASPQERQYAISRLRLFQAALLSFSSLMYRSEKIFHGYLRRSGVSQNEYGPAGVPMGARDPAFVDLRV